MSSPWKKKQPEVVVDAVLKRAEIGKIGRKLKTRLALAQFKAARGWEDLTLDTIEPKVEEELRKRRPTSSGDIFSDSSSSVALDFRSSPIKNPAIFSDQVGPRSGSGSEYRKRHYNSFEPSSSSAATSRKRFRSSPIKPINSRGYQLTQSSPIKPRKQPHFTTSSGPSLSFYARSSYHNELHSNFAAISDDEENNLPEHSFDIRSSPPHTPSPIRKASLGRRKNGRSGEEGADLLLYLATSPSPANPPRSRMQPPSTPPPKALALPSSMMTTPGGGGASYLSNFPNTPSQHFDFADFVNITPSPAQKAWPKTPRGAKTPLTVARRRLDFDNSSVSPNLREGGAKHTGLGMQLGGNLLS
ncbi:hypothetical protein WAI453_008385 [Rhynchosporium graminicola]|uniref:Cyclin-dependent kinase n=1 Tax=Rhynchosporium graminicola TaxID=2792576 RepID=A0A1E1KM20_9HELO|nr:uncharacterized protein RCO7_00438 [Rhynchosporium commune]